MIFPGKPPDYDAHANGDYNEWQRLYDRYFSIKRALDAGGYSTSPERDRANAELNDLDARLGEMRAKVFRDPNAEMDALEHMRVDNTGYGKTLIDRAFSRYNNNYFDEFSKTYQDYYNPQIEDQYRKSHGKTQAQLADRGMLGSTVGTGFMTDLLKQRNDARTQVASSSIDEANKLRGNIEQSKSNLYDLNESSNDPTGVAARAIGEASAFVAPPSLSPLGQIFAAALPPLANMGSAWNNRRGTPYQTVTGPVNNRGSGRVIT